MNGTTALHAFHNGTLVFTLPEGIMQLYPIWKPSTSQKETSPLDRKAINSLPHKSAAFVPQCGLVASSTETSMWKI